MVGKEQSIPMKIDLAKRAYNFAKTKSLTELIEGLEITKENINLERENSLSNDAIVTYKFLTDNREKYEELTFGRLYFSEDIDGNQTFLFKLEEYPPIFEKYVKEYLKGDENPRMILESSSYKTPKKVNLAHPSRKIKNNLSQDLTFKSHYHTGVSQNLWKI